MAQYEDEKSGKLKLHKTRLIDLKSGKPTGEVVAHTNRFSPSIRSSKSKVLQSKKKADFSKFKDVVKLKPCPQCGSTKVHTHE